MAGPLQTSSPKGFGQRHILALIGFFGYIISYTLRFNLSITIVAMVNDNNRSSILSKLSSPVHPDYACPHPNVFLLSTKNTSESLFLSNLKDINLSSVVKSNQSKSSLEIDDEPQGEFNWSESEQGLILGSFFWGYILTQIPGGYLGHRFGGKWPFGIGILITGLFAILTPFAANYGGKNWLIFVRVFQGLAGGITVPSMHGLLAKYLPPDERGKLTAFVYAGMPCGAAFSTIVSGYIIHYLGWSWVFYLSGSVSILWFALWSYLVYSSPEQHPRISQEELKYIQTSIKSSSEVPSNKPPWRKIAKSLPFYAVIVSHFCEAYGLYTIMTELPTYMKTVLHFDIKQNSLMSAFPHLLTWIVSILVTQLGDFFITKRYLSTGTVRKLCNSLGLGGFSAALLGVAFSGCDRTITVTLLALALAARGGMYGGFLVNLIDIAPNYCGLLISGVLAPLVTGMIIDANPSIQQWRLVFLITVGIASVGNIFFVLFASGEEQEWNRPNNDDLTISNKTYSLYNEQFGTFNYAICYSGPLTANLPMTMIITTRTNDDEETEVNDIISTSPT